MNYAVVENDRIVNVVICDDEDHAKEQGWVPLPEGAGIGSTRKGKKWLPPEPPPPW